MKLTKSKLTKMIKQELNEFTTTVGGTKATDRVKQISQTRLTKAKDVPTKSTALDTAKSTYDTKSAAKTAKQSTYNTKDFARTALNPSKYRKAGKVRGTYLYSSIPALGYSLNPEWTTADNERTTALSDKNTADTEYNTAARQKIAAQSDYDTAVDDLTAAEKADLMTKAQTGFGYGAGGGGRATGKGGTGKKGGGKKDESLFRVLGRDIINELKDLKKYRK